MTQAAKGQEPSMEEILASIRRIIADDDAARSASEGPDQSMDESSPRESEPASPPPSRPSYMSSEAAPSPERAMRDEEIDLMLAHLRAASRHAPAPAEEPPPERTPEPAPGHRSVGARPDMPPEESPPAPPPARAVEERSSAVEADEGGKGGLISPATAAAVDAAFDTLARRAQGGNGRTLEDLVGELLRPMLKTWLDDNLPGMVERLVRAEIERLSRGRG